MKEIRVALDFHLYDSGAALPYLTTINCIYAGVDIIWTYCLDFFSFDYLDVGYDVIFYKLDEDQNSYEVLRLSELLDPEKRKQYTDKEIRREHNVLKMFKAGAFKLKENTNGN